MKKVFTSKILRKMLILSILTAGLIFVVANDFQTVQARPCCSECPGGGDPVDADYACYVQCGGYNSCYYSCRNSAYACYATCDFTCNSGDTCGNSCSSDLQCFGGSGTCSFCIQGVCQ